MGLASGLIFTQSKPIGSNLTMRCKLVCLILYKDWTDCLYLQHGNFIWELSGVHHTYGGAVVGIWGVSGVYVRWCGRPSALGWGVSGVYGRWRGRPSALGLGVSGVYVRWRGRRPDPALFCCPAGPSWWRPGAGCSPPPEGPPGL